MSTREAILLVPGIRPFRQGEFLDLFVDNMENITESVSFTNREDAEIGGLKGKRLTYRVANGDERQLDLFECYYSDLVPNLAVETPLSKLAKGTQTMIFWLFSGIWRTIGSNRYMTLSGVLSASLLFVWYLTVLGVGLRAIGELTLNPESPVVVAATQFLGGIGTWLFDWTMLLGVGTVINFFPVDRLANVSNFLRLFLERADFRGTLRARVRKPLLSIVAVEEYSRVTVVAHSFGVLAATDTLADFQGGKVRMVSMGGPLKVLAHVGKWVVSEWNKCQKNHQITEWVDFFSDADYMGDELPFKDPVFAHVPRKLDDMGGLIRRLTGGTHSEYFHRVEVMESVLL